MNQTVVRLEGDRSYFLEGALERDPERPRSDALPILLAMGYRVAGMLPSSAGVYVTLEGPAPEAMPLILRARLEANRRGRRPATARASRQDGFPIGLRA